MESAASTAPFGLPKRDHLVIPTAPGSVCTDYIKQFSAASTEIVPISVKMLT